MNSTKLFSKINLKFLKENIKKSRGLLAFCLGIVPLINILILIVIASSLNNTIEILDLSSVSLITLLGLFIIPIVLAVSLFGFVFKSKSVDFVLSKPLSRSTIYITNIFGGILIITIFMLLNSLIYILFGLIFSNLIIPFSLVLDYFILFLVSYIFIFIVSSLAISIAGNLMGSIVLILIIICLCPFIKALNIYYYETNNYDIYIKCNDEKCKPEHYLCNNEKCISHLEKNEYEIGGNISFNEVFTAPFYSLDNLDNNNLYSTKSIIKMLVLTIIYIILGYYLFKKRKMENNETSFRNPKLHYFVKIITLIPISFICYLIFKEIYKLLKSSAISLASLVIFLGIYGLYDIKMNNNTIIIKDIKALSIYNINIVENKTYTAFNEKIKGKDLINTIINETLDINTDVAHGQRYLNVKTSGNKSYNLGLYWSKNTEKILREIKRTEEISYFKNYDYDQINFIGMYIKPTKKLKELIKNTMTNINEYSYDNNNFLLEVATYQNHKYETFYIMPNINKELDRYVMNERNKKAISFLENKEVEFSSDEEFPLLNYVLSKNITKFSSYLKNNNFEIKDNAFYIYAYNYHGMQILIGDKDSFKEEFKKYEKNLASDEYYQRLLESYNSDEEIYEDDLEEDYEY